MACKKKNWLWRVEVKKEGQKSLQILSAGLNWALFPWASVGFSNPTKHGYRELLHDWPGNLAQPPVASTQPWNILPAALQVFVLLQPLILVFAFSFCAERIWHG
jgi:hypothetical protein